MIDRHIYLEPDMDKEIAALAKLEQRSVAAQIRVLLSKGLDVEREERSQPIQFTRTR